MSGGGGDQNRAKTRVNVKDVNSSSHLSVMGNRQLFALIYSKMNMVLESRHAHKSVNTTLGTCKGRDAQCPDWAAYICDFHNQSL